MLWSGSWSPFTIQLTAPWLPFDVQTFLPVKPEQSCPRGQIFICVWANSKVCFALRETFSVTGKPLPFQGETTSEVGSLGATLRLAVTDLLTTKKSVL